MQVAIVLIGNFRGIRIPKSILQQLDFSDKVELEVNNHEILVPEFTGEDDFEWEWN